jgi:Membrane carboxypeptidase (penicillin-binding protein)
MFDCSEQAAINDYRERWGRTLAPFGMLSQENKQRLSMGMQEMEANYCLSCIHNGFCSAPADYDCPYFVFNFNPEDLEERFIALYQRHFPEHDWRAIFAGFDWKSFARAVLREVGGCHE